MLTANLFRCEYQNPALGIPLECPRFSWELAGDSAPQTAYQLEMALRENFAETVWSSGRVDSAAQVLVPYDGPVLRSATRYYTRVKLWDGGGVQGPWSEPLTLTTCLATGDWQAVFITGETGSDSASSAATCFRSDFTAREGLVAATLYASAKGVYEAFVNGGRVGDALLAPGWTEYHKRALYQTYDLTGVIRPGANALGAQVGPGWYKGDLMGGEDDRDQRCVYGKRTAFLAQLVLEYIDGSREAVATDETWQCASGPLLFTELYHGERYDARLEQPGWAEPGFSGEGWGAVAVESCDLSMLHPQDGPLVRPHEVFSPEAIFTTPRGEQVVDFGQNLSGLLRVMVSGKAGDRVLLRYAETLDAEGNFYTENLRSAKAYLEYTLKGGAPESYAPRLSFQGFRYVCIDEFPGEVTLDAFSVTALYSDMRPTGSFECSHPLLNRLVKNVEWGMKSNFVDIPTDCPQRNERMGWTGDAQVFVRAASYLMETAHFFEKWMRDVTAAQTEDGAVAHVVPNVLKHDPPKKTNRGACGWGDVAVVAPWVIYQYNGDVDILHNQYTSMQRWLAYIEANSEDGVLWNTGIHFGDWLALDAEEGSYYGATPNELSATAYFAYSALLMAKTADALGKMEDAERYRALYTKVAAAFRARFLTPEGRLAVQTQTAHVLALHFELVPEVQRNVVAADLVDLITQNDGHLTTGFLGTPYLLHALSKNGQLDEAYRLLLLEDYPSWLYQITKGATTIWEHWDSMKPDGSMWSPDMNSFNHYAYGSVADWIFSVLGGLDTDPERPGFRSILVEPRPGGGIDWANTRLHTPYGEVTLEWQVKNDRFTARLMVPPGTSAKVTLPLSGPDGGYREVFAGEHRFEGVYQKP